MERLLVWQNHRGVAGLQRKAPRLVRRAFGNHCFCFIMAVLEATAGEMASSLTGSSCSATEIEIRNKAMCTFRHELAGP